MRKCKIQVNTISERTNDKTEVESKKQGDLNVRNTATFGCIQKQKGIDSCPN